MTTKNVSSIEKSRFFMLQEVNGSRIEQKESMFDRFFNFQVSIDVEKMMINSDVVEVQANGYF